MAVFLRRSVSPRITFLGLAQAQQAVSAGAGSNPRDSRRRGYETATRAERKGAPPVTGTFNAARARTSRDRLQSRQQVSLA